MSMYNALFGRNPMNDVLLAMLGLSQSDVGRFRDTYVTEENGQPVIAVYTRNGGGNREHYAHDVHDVFDRESRTTTVYCRWNYDTGQWDNVTPGCTYGTSPGNEYDAHGPCFPEGPECDCTGCTITYRIPSLPGYIRDEDDDFDSTYCTVYFRAPDEWRDLLTGLVREGTPDSDWEEFLAALNDPPAEAATRPQKLAAQLIAGLKDAV